MNENDKLIDQCNAFNTKYPVGTLIFLKKDFIDKPIRTTVKHPTYILGGHTAVAFFEDVSGSYAINCVKGLAPY